MPFTPIHMGPALLLKSVMQRGFSLMVFGWSQIVMDIQPLVVMLRGQGQVHGFTHTYLGAFFVAIIAAVSGNYMAAFALRRMNMAGHLPIGWRVALISAFIGTFSHVLLDSVMHTDLEPFAPWSLDNPFLGVMSIDHLHLFCIGAGLVGLVLFPIVRRRSSLKNNSGGDRF